MTPSASDLLAATVMTTIYLSIVATAEAWRRWGNPTPESTRKLIHIAGGLVALCLPFVIESHWVVLVMAIGIATLFLAGKATGKLQSLHGVSRKSSGTEYFPLVIYLLFYLTTGESWKYFICILVLTTADSLAALVGGRYGRLRYEVDQNYKSVEGSLVFLFATFLAVVVPLLAWPLESRPSLEACLLTAMLVAMLTTGFEAVAQNGRDNLWVPMGTLLILNRSLPLPVTELAQEIILLVATGTFVTVATWRTATFNVGGTLVMILAVFGCWTLASMDWALPVFLAFTFYVLAVLKSPVRIKLPSKPVVKALLLPLLVMLSAAIFQQYGVARGYRFLYGPFLAGCVTITAQSAWDQVLRDRKMKHPAKFIGLITTTCLASAVVVLPTFLLQSGVSVVAPICVVVAALLVGISAGILFEHPALADSDRWWWLARMFSIIVMIGLLALVQAIGLSPVWNPR